MNLERKKQENSELVDLNWVLRAQNMLVDDEWDDAGEAEGT